MECAPHHGDGGSVLLVVDDYPENLISMRALLQRDDWQVVTAGSGLEALELLLVYDVDLVLLDVKMPGMDGFEVARLMRGSQRTCMTPIIFLSANAQSPAAVLEGYASGAIDYLFKPFDPHILKPKVQVLLEQQRNRRALQRLSHDLESARAFNASVLDNAAEGILVVSEAGVIEYANPAISRLLNAKIDELQGQEFLGFLQKPHVPTWPDSQMYAAYRLHETWRLHDALLRTGRGQQVPVALSCAPLPAEQRAMVVTVLDMSEVRHLHQQLEFQAVTDPLTGLLNRRGFHQAVESILLRSERGDQSLVLLYLDLNGLLRAADIAMYEAKRAGRQQYRYYDQEMNGRARSRLMLEDSVRTAIDNKDFTLVYQPQVSLADGRLRGVEALLRWQHPSVGDVPPGLFLPLLEEARLISQLSAWIYQQAGAQRQAWQTTFDEELVLSVSLSSSQFNMPNLANQMQQVIERHGLQARQLEVAIGEDCLMNNLEEATKQLKLLRHVGVRIALDDFGCGPCSLAHLRDLAFDTLKLDPQLVARLPGSVRDAAMARSIIELCGHFEVLVVAEGVETPEQAQWLKANGCAFIQGPWAAQPLMAEDVVHWSRARVR